MTERRRGVRSASAANGAACVYTVSACPLPLDRTDHWTAAQHLQGTRWHRTRLRLNVRRSAYQDQLTQSRLGVCVLLGLAHRPDRRTLTSDRRGYCGYLAGCRQPVQPVCANHVLRGGRGSSSSGEYLLWVLQTSREAGHTCKPCASVSVEGSSGSGRYLLVRSSLALPVRCYLTSFSCAHIVHCGMHALRYALQYAYCNDMIPWRVLRAWH
jgi:hypothetical protein